MLVGHYIKMISLSEAKKYTKKPMALHPKQQRYVRKTKNRKAIDQLKGGIVVVNNREYMPAIGING